MAMLEQTAVRYNVMSMSDKIIELLDSGIVELGFEDISNENLFESAREKSLLPQLYSVYSKHAPSDTRLKDYYHHANLKTAITHDVNIDINFQKTFINYIVNWGRKYLLINSIPDTEIPGIFSSKLLAEESGESFIIDETNLLNDQTESEEEIQPKIICKKIFSNEHVVQVLFYETVAHYVYEQPRADLLSEGGKQLINKMKLQKKILTHCFHKLILNKNDGLVIGLIDKNALRSKETPADKMATLIKILKSRYGLHCYSGVPSFLGFFPAINKLYKDKDAGQVQWGYFTTSTGARFTNKAKGSDMDLRLDPFQQGGEKVEDRDLDFTKLDLVWRNVEGLPEINLHGSSHMHNNPKDSLPWAEILFSTDSSCNHIFLKKLLGYVYE